MMQMMKSKVMIMLSLVVIGIMAQPWIGPRTGYPFGSLPFAAKAGLYPFSGINPILANRLAFGVVPPVLSATKPGGFGAHPWMFRPGFAWNTPFAGIPPFPLSPLNVPFAPIIAPKKGYTGAVFGIGDGKGGYGWDNKDSKDGGK